MLPGSPSTTTRAGGWRRRRRPALVGAAAAALVLTAAAPALATSGDGVFANLSGVQEVPGPGDPDATGAAIVTLYPRAGRVCADISLARVGEPVMAHIHAGRAGVAGPVVIGLTSAVTGGARCTSGVSQTLIEKIQRHPARYYVNVHTAEYPNGALRGQLHG